MPVIVGHSGTTVPSRPVVSNTRRDILTRLAAFAIAVALLLAVAGALAALFVLVVL